MTTTYHGAVRDSKTGKFSPLEDPKDTVVIGVRVDRELRDKLKTIPNGTAWLKQLVTEAIANYDTGN